MGVLSRFYTGKIIRKQWSASGVAIKEFDFDLTIFRRSVGEIMRCLRIRDLSIGLFIYSFRGFGYLYSLTRITFLATGERREKTLVQKRWSLVHSCISPLLSGQISKYLDITYTCSAICIEFGINVWSYHFKCVYGIVYVSFIVHKHAFLREKKLSKGYYEIKYFIDLHVQYPVFAGCIEKVIMKATYRARERE